MMKSTLMLVAAAWMASTSAFCNPGSSEAPQAAGESLHVPRLTVNDWYFELDGEPLFIVGYNPGMAEEQEVFGEPSRGRLSQVPPGVNYMRTWLTWQYEGQYRCPFLRVDGKADLSRIDPAWLDALTDFLDASARAGVIQELTLFNPWFARADWAAHDWNPANNIQGLDVDTQSLYTLDNPCLPYQEQWVEAILGAVDASLARHATIIEIDNELKTGGGAWREHFVRFVKERGDYIVSTIATYCGDYDAVGGPNDVVCLHTGGSGNPGQHYQWVVDLPRTKPVVFNELYVWWHHPREKQRAVFWNAFLAGAMPCAYQWADDGRTSRADTAQDLSALARFADSIPFHRLRPDDQWVEDAPGEFRAASQEDGGAFLAYFWGGETGSIQLNLPDAAYTVSWVSPETGGAVGALQELHAAGTVTLDLPDHHHDIVCYIQRTKT